MNELIELASSLISCESTNPPGSEQAASNLVASVLSRAGLKVDRVKVLGHGDSIVAILPSKHRDAPALLFTGHLDVVPVSASERTRWASDPFVPQVRDGRLIGRGATDMLGGLAALVTAATTAAEGKVPRDVILAITTDEEDRMSGSKALADHLWLRREADLIVCEPTSLHPCTIGKGRTWADITVHGETGHGSNPTAPNALELALALLVKLSQEDFSLNGDPEYGLSAWHPLAMRAGVQPCVVPDTATFTLDARLVPDHDPHDVWERAGRTCADFANRTGARIDIDVIDRREGWRTPVASPLVTRVFDAVDAEASLGPLPRDLCFAGTTDGTVLRRQTDAHGVRDAVIVGPGELYLAHRENESVALDQVDAAERLYRRLMMEG